jgi:hypothetical protein
MASRERAWRAGLTAAEQRLHDQRPAAVVGAQQSVLRTGPAEKRGAKTYARGEEDATLGMPQSLHGGMVCPARRGWPLLRTFSPRALQRGAACATCVRGRGA